MGERERGARRSGQEWACLKVYVVLLKSVHVVKEVNYVNYEDHWLWRQVWRLQDRIWVTRASGGRACRLVCDWVFNTPSLQPMERTSQLWCFFWRLHCLQCQFLEGIQNNSWSDLSVHGCRWIKWLCDAKQDDAL